MKPLRAAFFRPAGRRRVRAAFRQVCLCLVFILALDATASVASPAPQALSVARSLPLSSEVGENDFLIGDMQVSANANTSSRNPALAVNPLANSYLVVWSADDGRGALADDEFEIWGQLVGPGDQYINTNFRISAMGADGQPEYGADYPAVAFNPTLREYLVVWDGDDNHGALVDDEFEIFGQRLSETGALLGQVLRISDMGPDGSAAYGAHQPAVAYNPSAQEYLVIWQGDDDTDPLVDDENEIFGQRLSAGGSEIGANDFRLSSMGPDGDPNYDALQPQLVYNPDADEYLLAWSGDDNAGLLVDDEFEIYVQRIDAFGAQLGVDDRRISAQGPDGQSAFDAVAPSLAYDTADHQYLVVWQGNDADTPVGASTIQIFGQRLDSAGVELGNDDFRISRMHSNSSVADDGARNPSVTYHPTLNHYLVVWEGWDLRDRYLPYYDYEIYARRLDAASGAEVWADNLFYEVSITATTGAAHNPAAAYNPASDEYLVAFDGNVSDVYCVHKTTGEYLMGPQLRLSFMGTIATSAFDAAYPDVAFNSSANQYLVVWRGDTLPDGDNDFEIYAQRLDANGGFVQGRLLISDMGPPGDPNYTASDPAIVYNPTSNQYLVVWEGRDDLPGMALGEAEIFGQLLDTSGHKLGGAIRISDMGPDGDSRYTAASPSLAYNPASNEYLVVWSGSDDTGALVAGELEIFGQRLSADGGEVGTNDFRISDLGPDGDSRYDVFSPAAVFNSASQEYWVVWHGDNDSPGLADDELEIYGQRLDAAGGEVGANDFRLSHTGADDGAGVDASYPTAACNPIINQCIVVWQTRQRAPGAAGPAIFGQRLSGAGEALGVSDFRISAPAAGSAWFPDIAVNPAAGVYMVVWHGEDPNDLLTSGEDEIFGQGLDGGGVKIGKSSFRLSDMGPNGAPAFAARFPALAADPANEQFLVVWEGNDAITYPVNPQFQVFGQRFQPNFDLVLPMLMK